ncbi:hypothetical protein QE152_g35936 [Popillia japonica]|uniref:Uncharacterized protein n=1 Tax=Popillia japonica TaxID=7064 RepID=A0AAW1IEM1_POPJA
MCAFVLHLQDPCETGTYTREFDNVGRRGHPTPSGSLCRFGRIPRAQHRLIYRSTLTYPCTDFQSLVGFIYSVIVLFEQVAFGAPAVRLHRIKLQSQWRKSRNLIWEILIYGTIKKVCAKACWMVLHYTRGIQESMMDYNTKTGFQNNELCYVNWDGDTQRILPHKIRKVLAKIARL